MSSAAQRSFASGELAPALWPRTDAQRYGEGARTMRNFTVGRAGGAKSRAGFAFVDETTVGAIGRAALFLVPWVQSRALPYLMEIGSHTSGTLSYLRLWLNGARVTVGTPSAWITATPYTSGECVSVSGTNYYCFLAHTSGASTQPGIGASWEDNWWALESNILEIPLPYSAAELVEVQWVDEDETTRLLAHASHPTQELVRVSATEWSIADVVWEDAPTLTAPANPDIADPGTGSAATFTQYKIAALSGDTEGPLSVATGWNKRPGYSVNPLDLDDGNRAPLEVSWDAVAGATGYRVFRSYSSGPYYKVIDVTDLEYRDVGEVSQTGLTQEPAASGVEIVSLNAADEYPGVVANFQQRLVVSGRTLTPDEVFASRAGTFRDFTFRSPIVDDDAMGWRQASTTFNRITHLVESMGQLVAFSEIGEGVVNGDTDDILRPGEANPRQSTFNGAAQSPRPLNLNDAILYVQARGSVVRDLIPAGRGAVEGDEISETAHHLVDGYTIVSWAFQQTPDPIVWMVRSDGAMLSVTYNRKRGLVAWSRHDSSDDAFLSVACVPEGGRDVLYALITRSGGTYLERMSDRNSSDPGLRLHVDSAVTTATDGVTVEAGSSTPASPAGTTLVNMIYNTGATPDRIEEANGSNAQHEVAFDEVPFSTVYSSYAFEAYFQQSQRTRAVVLVRIASWVAEIDIDLVTGTVSAISQDARFELSATTVANGAGWDFTLSVSIATASRTAINAGLLTADPTAQITLYPSRTFGDGGLYTGTTNSGCIAQVTLNECTDVLPDRITGLSHLEGESVSVLADGVVLASPATATRLVMSGAVELTALELATYTDYVIGLPIISDLRTLDIDTVDGRTIKERGQIVSRLGVWVEESRSLWAGPDVPAASTVSGLARITVDDASQQPLTTTYGTGYIEGNLLGRFSKGGSVFIRHVDPTPLTVLAVMPMGKIGG